MLYRPEDVASPVPGETTLAGSSRPDITRFLNARSVDRPSLSPDGRMLAFLGQMSGHRQLWVVDAHGGWPRQLTFGGPVTFIEWVPDSDRILYAVDRAPGAGRAGFWVIDAAGTRERELMAPFNSTSASRSATSSISGCRKGSAPAPSICSSFPAAKSRAVGRSGQTAACVADGL